MITICTFINKYKKEFVLISIIIISIIIYLILNKSIDKFMDGSTMVNFCNLYFNNIKYNCTSSNFTISEADQFYLNNKFNTDFYYTNNDYKLIQYNNTTKILKVYINTNNENNLKQIGNSIENTIISPTYRFKPIVMNNTLLLIDNDYNFNGNITIYMLKNNVWEFSRIFENIGIYSYDLSTNGDLFIIYYKSRDMEIYKYKNNTWTLENPILKRGYNGDFNENHMLSGAIIIKSDSSKFAFLTEEFVDLSSNYLQNIFQYLYIYTYNNDTNIWILENKFLLPKLNGYPINIFEYNNHIKLNEDFTLLFLQSKTLIMTFKYENKQWINIIGNFETTNNGFYRQQLSLNNNKIIQYLNKTGDNAKINVYEFNNTNWVLKGSILHTYETYTSANLYYNTDANIFIITDYFGINIYKNVNAVNKLFLNIKKINLNSLNNFRIINIIHDDINPNLISFIYTYNNTLNIDKTLISIDCEGSYGEFSECSATCGGGTRTKTYDITTPAQNGGTPCPTSPPITEPCNTDPCPINCVGSYGEFSQCSKTCGGGTRTKTYEITTPEQHGGAPCPISPTINETCNTQPCPIDCEGYFITTEKCSKECDGGKETIKYVISQEGKNGGKECEYTDGYTDRVDCNIFECANTLDTPYYKRFKPLEYNKDRSYYWRRDKLVEEGIRRNQDDLQQIQNLQTSFESETDEKKKKELQDELDLYKWRDNILETKDNNTGLSRDKRDIITDYYPEEIGQPRVWMERHSHIPDYSY